MTLRHKEMHMSTKHVIKFAKFDRYEGSHHDELEAPIVIDGEDVGTIKQSCSWDTLGALTAAGDRKKVDGYTIELSEHLSGDEGADDVTTVHTTLKGARDWVRHAMQYDAMVIADVEDTLAYSAARKAKA